MNVVIDRAPWPYFVREYYEDNWKCETPHPDSCRWAWDGYEYVCNAAILHVMGQPTHYAMPWRKS